MRVKRALTFVAVALAALTGWSCGGENRADPSEIQEDSGKEVMYLFVQNAHSGSFVPVAGEENLYTLTLENVAPQTIFFSDRPERIVGQVENQPFLDGMCFTEENPPNAAIVVLDADENEDVAVVELFDPVYNAEAKTLRYRALVLQEPDHSYAEYNERHDGTMPESFGSAALFIDGCPARGVLCMKEDAVDILCGTAACCTCWDWGCGFQSDCCSQGRCNDHCIDVYGEECGIAVPITP